MHIHSDDRLHAKQGRSTCRVTFDSPHGPLSVYLKRHYRLPLGERLVAWLDPDGKRSPAGAEWRHLQYARRLGLDVPDAVAAGETIGPWARVQSYLMVRELTGQLPLHEAIPLQHRTLSPAAFHAWKRRVTTEVARTASRLHRAGASHKDLYLCHFYVDAGRPGTRTALIDLHRLGVHPMLSAWFRWKDLAQLLFSTHGVDGLNGRDALRFWAVYQRGVPLAFPRLQAAIIRWRAARYLSHNRPKRRLSLSFALSRKGAEHV